MTEAEARTKWCPHAVVDNHPMTAGVNRWAVSGSTVEGKMMGTNCLGSGCMAWRWAQERNPAWAPNHSISMPDYRHPADIAMPWKPSTTEGYCGLAGKP